MSSKRASIFMGIIAVTLMIWAPLGMSEEVKVKLTGDQEVPPVKTSASGSGSIHVNDDKSVSGSVRITGMEPVAAHIHQGAAGQNGPVSVPFAKTGDNEWSIPAGSKLNDAQYKAFKAGELYVNVHSKAHKDGEIRAQLKP